MGVYIVRPNAARVLRPKSHTQTIKQSFLIKPKINFIRRFGHMQVLIIAELEFYSISMLISY